ncbi:AAA family ATPase [Streptomyces chattanoogensis]|uniref:AAA family ATPase n=1 Tax=Streptomyces chattanoogensis TaxID=66876 RepID=UPI0036C45484
MSAWADHRPLPEVVGRAVEHERVSGLLDGSPLVTLTGGAGAGKSVLARAVLDERIARHGGTVIRVGCWDGLSDGGLTDALLEAAGLPAAALPQALKEPGGTRVAGAQTAGRGAPFPYEPPRGGPRQARPADGATLAALAAHCVQQGATLLLDDCDPVLDACAQLVRRLLRAEPTLQIVVTSRRSLGLPLERVVDIAPLPVTLGEGIAGPAVELLAARAESEAAPELLVAVCEALEGSPLAIELAARQLDRMSLPQLAAQVSADGPLFYSGPAPTARHTSLYAAHAAGYALCSPTDRRVWARLSVLPGDFDPWLAGCVCASSDVPAPEIDAALERLRLASVLERVRESGGPQDTRAALSPRYRLPRGARDFGRTQLREAGEESAALRRFRQACAALAAEAQIAWQGPDQQIAVRLVEDEQHNLDAALTRPPQDADDALSALEIAVSLWFQWGACGYRREGRAHLDRLLLLSRGDTPLRARALWLAGWLAAQEHALATAEALLDQAWTAAVMHADDDGLARIAHAHGVLALYREDSGAAVACLEEAAGHRSKDPWFGPGPAHSCALLAIALSAVDAEEAANAAHRAWESRHSDGDFWLYSTVLYARALTERAHGRPEAALRACRKALAAKKLVGDPLFIAGARNLLAAVRREVREGAAAPESGAGTRWWQRGGGVRTAPFFSRLRTGS